MYTNPFIYKRPLYPGQDDLIAIDRPILLEKAITGLELGQWFSLCGGKKTGKTSFLLRLIDKCKQRNPGFHFITISLENLQNIDQHELNRVICRRINDLSLGKAAHLLSVEQSHSDSYGLNQFLPAVSDGLDEHNRIIFVLDSFETVPKAVAHEILLSLINLRNSEAAIKSLSKFQFIVAGTLTLSDLQIDDGRAFSEYAMKTSVEDFRFDDVDDMLKRVCGKLNIDCHTGFSRLLYEETGGAGYLVQKICYRILETVFTRNERPEFSLKRADEAIAGIVRKGETNVEIMIRQIEKDTELVESLLRTMRAGALRSTKFDVHLKTLVSLGALVERNGAYRVRNRIYETIFRDNFTTEHLASLYFSQRRHHRAKELFSEAMTQQMDAKNALESLLASTQTICKRIRDDRSAKSILQTFMGVVNGAQNCSIMILDEEHKRLRIAESIGLDPNDVSQFELNIGEGVAGWVAQTGRTRVVRDVTDEIECPEFARRQLAEKMNVGAMVSLPLQSAEYVFGVLSLCLSKPHEFTFTDIKMLEILAAQASLALQSLPLYQYERSHEDDLYVVQDLIKGLGHYMELDVIFERMLAAVKQITRRTGAYIAFKESESAGWKVILSEGEQVSRAMPAIDMGDEFAAVDFADDAPSEAPESGRNIRRLEIEEAVKNNFAIQLSIDGEAIGYLVIPRESQTALSKAQAQLISMLVDLVCIAMKNHRLYGIAEKQTQQVITSKGIAQAISHEKSMQEILNVIAQESLNVVGYPNKVAFVLMKDKERDKLIVKAAQGEGFTHGFIGKSLPMQEISLAQKVLREGKPYIVNDAFLENGYHEMQPGARSEIAAPMYFRDEAIGVIDILSTEPDDFDLLDEEALIAVAQSAAIATKIGELCDVRIKELQALYRIGTKISSSLNINEVLRTICRESLDAIGTENRNISIQLIEPEHQMPSTKVMLGLNSVLERSAPNTSWEKTREYWVVKNKSHFLSPEVSNDSLHAPSSPRTKSAMFVPVIFDNKVTGVITMESSVADDFGEAELRLIQGLANQAGVAIENARLNEGLARAQLSLSKVVETAAIEETVAGLTHDIKNFSTMISGETQWLEKLDTLQLLHFEEVKTAIKNINSYVKKIEDFTNSLKGRAYRQPLVLKRANLREILDETIQLVEARASHQKVKIDRDLKSLNTHVNADAGLLVRAFVNIVTNALDAMPNGGVLNIDAHKNKDHLCIGFSDTGMGIPEENLTKVMEPLFTTKTRGYGLGLAIAKRIIETDHRGTFNLKSKVGEGTAAEVCLPFSFPNKPINHKKTGAKFSESASAKMGISTSPAVSILVVNDDSAILMQILQILRLEGFDAIGADTGKVAVEYCKRNGFDAIVMDYHLEKDEGRTRTAIDFIPDIKKSAPDTPIILTSASIEFKSRPEIYGDYFLEINQSFWNEIIGLINRCLSRKLLIAAKGVELTVGERMGEDVFQNTGR